MSIPRRIVEALKGIVGDRWVLTNPTDLVTYDADGLQTHPAPPGVVVLPENGEEVAAVLKALAKSGVPFVARGAGTGLSGGAIASDDSVLIVLTRLNRILDIDPANRPTVGRIYFQDSVESSQHYQHRIV